MSCRVLGRALVVLVVLGLLTVGNADPTPTAPSPLPVHAARPTPATGTILRASLPVDAVAASVAGGLVQRVEPQVVAEAVAGTRVLRVAGTPQPPVPGLTLPLRDLRYFLPARPGPDDAPVFPGTPPRLQLRLRAEPKPLLPATPVPSPAPD